MGEDVTVSITGKPENVAKMLQAIGSGEEQVSKTDVGKTEVTKGSNEATS